MSPRLTSLYGSANQGGRIARSGEPLSEFSRRSPGESSILLPKFGERPIVEVFLVYGLKVGEYALFGIDLILFLVFLAKTSWRMVKEL